MTTHVSSTIFLVSQSQVQRRDGSSRRHRVNTPRFESTTPKYAFQAIVGVFDCGCGAIWSDEPSLDLVQTQFMSAADGISSCRRVEFGENRRDMVLHGAWGNE